MKPATLLKKILSGSLLVTCVCVLMLTLFTILTPITHADPDPGSGFWVGCDNGGSSPGDRTGCSVDFLGSVGWLGYDPLTSFGYRHKVTFLRGNPRVGQRPLAARSPRHFAAEAMAPGDASGWRQSRVPRLLSGRVHVSVQPPDLARAGACSSTASFSKRSQSSPCRTSYWLTRPEPVPEKTTTCWGHLSELNTPLDELQDLMFRETPSCGASVRFWDRGFPKLILS